jgi:hypothetical protein
VVLRASPYERGAALSTFTALSDLGQLLVGPSMGFLLRASNFTTMFCASATVVTIGAVVFAVWDPLVRRTLRDHSAAG